MQSTAESKQGCLGVVRETLKLVICKLSRLSKVGRKPLKLLWLIIPLIGFCHLTDIWRVNVMNVKPKIIFNLTTNYLRPVAPQKLGFQEEIFLVYNNKCRIGDGKMWEKQLGSLVFSENSSTCDEVLEIKGTIRGFTSVKDQLLLVNKEALIPLGMNLNETKCCYHVVHPVKLNIAKYKQGDEYRFGFSKKCYPMKEKTSPHSGFLKVICHRVGSYVFPPVRIHTDFHLLAIFPSGNQSADLLANKLAHWEKCRQLEYLETNGCGISNSSSAAGSPPNVLLIILDSISRINFRRMMPGAKFLLEDVLGAVEMNGFTKVGMNSFPNFMPMTTSYSEAEVSKYCLPSWKSGLSKLPVEQSLKCPFLWNTFSTQHYLTSFFEDRPTFYTFQYSDVRFVNEPVDLYYGPWLNAANEHNGKGRCIGYRRTDQVVLDYVRDLARLAVSRGIPYFFTAIISDFTHDSMSEPKLAGIALRDILLQMKFSGSLENTVLMVMGDHGQRYTKIRQTLSGWYEDKLPALWIKLPDSLIKAQPTWEQDLKFNSKQLMTVYDIHATLMHLFSTLNATSYKEIQKRQEEIVSNKPLRGLTLFRRLPERTCEEAGVPWEFCACVAPIEFQGSDSVIQLATRAVIDPLNSIMHTKCNITIPRYDLIAVGIVPKVPLLPDQYELQPRDTGSMQEEHLFQGHSHLVIGFSNKTFQMEAVLAFNSSSKTFNVLDLFLVSKYTMLLSRCAPSIGFAYRQAS